MSARNVAMKCRLELSARNSGYRNDDYRIVARKCRLETSARNVNMKCRLECRL